MSKISRWLALGMVTAIVVANSGCDREPRPPEKAKVSGLVTLDGDPVEGANVNFMADGASSTAGGKTDAQGKYSFEAVIGKNTVSVTKTVGGANTQMSEEDMKRGNMAAAFQNATPLEHKLPMKYSAANSQLSTTIEKGKDNVYDIPLLTE